MEQTEGISGERSTRARIAAIGAVTICMLVLGTAGARILGPGRKYSLAGGARPADAAAEFGTSSADVGVPVPATARQAYAISQADDPSSMMVLYTSPLLPAEQVVEFYCQEMPMVGWQEIESYEEELNRYTEGVMLFFRQPGRECIIHVERGGAGSAWTVMIRPVIIGGGRK